MHADAFQLVFAVLSFYLDGFSCFSRKRTVYSPIQSNTTTAAAPTVHLSHRISMVRPRVYLQLY